MDYSEYGGALLLGVNGIIIIGHGGSNRKAIKNAIHLSKKFIVENVLDKISQEVEKMQNSFQELRYV
jgi:glycerol-3-phosphate acyltransferase PlsX